MFKKRRIDRFSLIWWRMLGRFLADHFDELPEAVKGTTAMTIAIDAEIDMPANIDRYLRNRPQA